MVGVSSMYDGTSYWYVAGVVYNNVMEKIRLYEYLVGPNVKFDQLRGQILGHDYSSLKWGYISD